MLFRYSQTKKQKTFQPCVDKMTRKTPTKKFSIDELNSIGHASAKKYAQLQGISRQPHPAYSQLKHPKCSTPKCSKSKTVIDWHWTSGAPRYRPVCNDCHGIVTAGGFQTSVEALYLGKKLMLVPTYGQYEQSCNAIALEKKGVMSGEISDIKNFVEKSKVVKMDWKDSTGEIVSRILGI